MGIYYNPNPPHIGAQQPLDQRKLTPPISGPLPQNPPFRGSRVGQEVLNCWAAALAVAAIAPITSPLLIPQPPVVVQPQRVPYEIYRAWDPPAPAAQVAINLDPPVAGPAPQNPPFSETAWAPYPADTTLPYDLLVRRAGVPASAPVPSNPPFMGGARVSLEVQVNWLPPAPAPIVGPKFTAGAAQAAAYVPPGASIPQSVLATWWLAPVPAPILAANLDPPIGVASFPFVGTAVSVATLAWWAPASWQMPTQSFVPQTQVATSFPFVGAKLSAEILQWWRVADLPPTLPRAPLPVSGPVPSQPPLGGGARVPLSVLSAWLPPLPAPVIGVNFAPPPTTLTTNSRFISPAPARAFFSKIGLLMPQGPDLSQMDVGETIVCAVDFAAWLVPGVMVTQIVSVTAVNYLPAGGSPYVSLVGSPQIGTATNALGGSGVTNAAVLQELTGVSAGAIRLTATVKTTDGQTLIAWVHQVVSQPS